MKADSKSFVGALKASPNVFWAVVIGALSLAAFFATGYIVWSDGGKDQQSLQQVAELRAQAYRLTSLSRDATSGSEKAFGELANVTSRMEASWSQLRSGDPRMASQLKTSSNNTA